MKKCIRSLILLPIIFLFSGCTINSKDLHYLNQKLAYSSKKNIGLVYNAPTLELNKIDAIALEPVAVDLYSKNPKKKVSNKVKVEAEKLASSLEVELISKIPQNTLFSVISEGEVLPENSQIAHLKVVVTEFDPGNGAARYIVGYGAGSTVAQIECQLTDNENNLLLAFAKKEAHSGNPTLGLNVSSVSNDYTYREIRKKLVDSITKVLRGESK